MLYDPPETLTSTVAFAGTCTCTTCTVARSAADTENTFVLALVPMSSIVLMSAAENTTWPLAGALAHVWVEAVSGVNSSPIHRPSAVEITPFGVVTPLTVPAP